MNGKNKKKNGFTLVELLAVIIILAIVVGIAIPGITSIIDSSKNNALGTSVENAANWLQKQYDLLMLDESLVEPSLIDILNNQYVQYPVLQDKNGKNGKSGGTILTTYNSTNTDAKQAAANTEEYKEIREKFIKAMGFDTNEISCVRFIMYSDGTVCVAVYEILENSKYNTSKYWVKKANNESLPTRYRPKNGDTKYQSKGCKQVNIGGFK